ncbi:hypothetical protein Landi51_07474 [Colletotrichum acutatum]
MVCKGLEPKQGKERGSESMALLLLNLLLSDSKFPTSSCPAGPRKYAVIPYRAREWRTHSQASTLKGHAPKPSSSRVLVTKPLTASGRPANSNVSIASKPSVPGTRGEWALSGPWRFEQALDIEKESIEAVRPASTALSNGWAAFHRPATGNPVLDPDSAPGPSVIPAASIPLPLPGLSTPKTSQSYPLAPGSHARRKTPKDPDRSPGSAMPLHRASNVTSTKVNR